MILRTTIILFMVTALLACEREAPVSEQPTVTVRAQIVKVMPQEISETYTTTGSLVADDRVDIASRLMGFIRSINVDEGNSVKEGQLLLTIDPTEINARLSEAKARVAQAKANLAETEADYSRYKTLYEQRLVALNQYRKVELAYQLASEELHAAHSTLEGIEVQLQYAEIRSPVSGVIVAKHKQSGDIATPGSPLLTIENPKNIVVRTFIEEQHIDKIRIGTPAIAVIEAAGIETEAMVSNIVPAADPATHSYLVKLVLGDIGQARSGMFSRVNFSMGFSHGITIAKSAITQRADIEGVYIVDNDNVSHYRMVRTGRQFTNTVEIVSGLRTGDRVIIAADKPVHSGMSVITDE